MNTFGNRFGNGTSIRRNSIGPLSLALAASIALPAMSLVAAGDAMPSGMPHVCDSTCQHGQKEMNHDSGTFSGVKANTGHVTHATVNGKSTLTLSDDFKVPDAPAPHWQVVDSNGNVYLLQRLVIKGDKLNKTITLPAYIKDVVKVQIWCAWAEALLGEASFESAVR